MTAASVLVHEVAQSQQLCVSAKMSIIRSDEADGAVAVLKVVPANEGGHPRASLLKAGEGFVGKGGTVLEGTEERLGEEGCRRKHADEGGGQENPSR